MGLGDDWNENLLDQIGSLSNGDSDLIESADEIVPLFTQTVQRSQQAVVRDARMTLRLVSGVVPRQVWQVTPVIANVGYTAIGEHDVQFELGELDAVGQMLLISCFCLHGGRAPSYRSGRDRKSPVAGSSGALARSDIVLNYTTGGGAAGVHDDNSSKSDGL